MYAHCPPRAFANFIDDYLKRSGGFKKAMDTMHIVMSVIEVLACLFLIVTILLQEGTSQGLSGTIAGGAETFFGSKKAHGMQSTLSKVTTVVAIVFVVLAVALNLL